MSTINIQLTPGDDFEARGGPGNFNGTIQAFDGRDTILLGGDYTGINIGLDGDDDLLTVGEFGAPTSFFRDSTVTGGQGEDNVQFFVNELSGSSIELDLGNDRLVLSTRPAVPFPGPGSNIDGNTFLGGGGTDAILVLNTVNTFNNNLLDLGGNDGTVAQGFIDFLIDGLVGGTAFLDLIEQGPIVEYAYVAATEVFNSTIRGLDGDDILFFESFTGSPDDISGQDLALNQTLVNGNKGQDFIGIARNVANGTSILGGQGNDNMIALSGTFNDSRMNGNMGADLVTLLAIEANRSTFFGGQGDDLLDIASATIFSSKVSGDLGNDKINFFAAVSANTTLSGGDGNDEIDDFSSAISNIGNKLEGGAGNDILRQAGNIAADLSGGATNGIFDFAATFIGGTGRDIMTGDLATQLLGEKRLIAGETDVEGASSDTFQFSFGDSVINANGIGRDIITDFDSNASRYLANGVVAFNNPFINPFTDFLNPQVAIGIANATPLSQQRERDVIDLVDTNISINLTGLAGTVFVNNRGLVTGGVGNLQDFVAAGASLTTRGAALLWEEGTLTPPVPGPINLIPPRSQLFISDGVAGLTSGDLLIQLDQVAGFQQLGANTGGLVIQNGNITDILLAAV